jgi:methyl-accepting chemotaxis protein
MRLFFYLAKLPITNHPRQPARGRHPFLHSAQIQSQGQNPLEQAHGAIGGTIGRMSEICSTIASAIEEQGAATREISRNVQQAAQGTQEVSANITDVQHGASQSGTASSQVLSGAKSLSSESKRLQLEVGKFLNTARAA